MIILVNNKVKNVTNKILRRGYKPVNNNGFYIELNGMLIFYYYNSVELNGIKPKNIEDLNHVLDGKQFRANYI